MISLKAGGTVILRPRPDLAGGSWVALDVRPDRALSNCVATEWQQWWSWQRSSIDGHFEGCLPCFRLHLPNPAWMEEAITATRFQFMCYWCRYCDTHSAWFCSNLGLGSMVLIHSIPDHTYIASVLWLSRNLLIDSGNYRKVQLNGMLLSIRHRLVLDKISIPRRFWPRKTSKYCA